LIINDIDNINKDAKPASQLKASPNKPPPPTLGRVEPKENPMAQKDLKTNNNTLILC
jgi:hypothetical protein|tara:strand:- start:153 stop:323 length:171 start_codon:yes stop_codon:yes gene_type:complete